MNDAPTKNPAKLGHSEPTPFDDVETISPRQLAQLLDVSVSTVLQGKLTRGGPPFVQVSNKRKRYRVADVRAWMDSLPKEG